MRFWHGTSLTHMPAIRTGGLRSAAVADTVGLAAYYARETAEADGGVPVLLAVDLDLAELTVDAPSLLEPVLIGARRHHYEQIAAGQDLSLEDAVWSDLNRVAAAAGTATLSELPVAEALRITGTAAATPTLTAGCWTLVELTAVA